MRSLYLIPFTLCVLAQTALAQADRPNVVLMLADNVGWGDIGAYGGGEVRGMPTPRIDQLAAEGLQLTQFLVEPACTPSRAALMTGRYSVRAGLGTLIIAGTPNTLQAEEFTLAELFKSRGYSTGMTGKWHLGFEEQSWPTRQGFDEYRVGVIETTDGTYYRENMQRSGVPESEIQTIVPRIYEGDADGDLQALREYTVEYRGQVEADIAEASVDYIRRHANGPEPFFLYIGWTHTHYPVVTAPEFTGKASYRYGDAVMELDHRTGQVLDAITESGIEDNTIVIWLSDNGAMPTSGPPIDRGGSNGPFRGELGDALEGSLRVPGMIKWPGRIEPRKSNEMVSIHDFLPTLAAIIGATLPEDRPYDGVDQRAFFLGEQQESNREHLISFVQNEVAAVRWRQYRFYPKSFIGTFGNPSMQGLAGARVLNNEGPALYNIEMDQREEINVATDNAWVYAHYLRILGEYKASLEMYPNPPGVTLYGPRFDR